MRYEQHKRTCEICGNTYLYYQGRDPDTVNLKIPNEICVGDNPRLCPSCVELPDEDLKEIPPRGTTPGGEEVEGYGPGSEEPALEFDEKQIPDEQKAEPSVPTVEQEKATLEFNEEQRQRHERYIQKQPGNEEKE